MTQFKTQVYKGKHLLTIGDDISTLVEFNTRDDLEFHVVSTYWDSRVTYYSDYTVEYDGDIISGIDVHREA